MVAPEKHTRPDAQRVNDFAFQVRTLLTGAVGMLELIPLTESAKEREEFRVNALKAMQHAAKAVTTLVDQISGRVPNVGPVVSGIQATVSAKNAPKPSVDRALSILVVDDNEINQKIVSRILSTRGHSVVLAGNGVDGVNAYMRGNFDLVLMDVMMPVMNGAEAARLIKDRRGSAARKVPIVALTALDEGEREMWQEVMDGYLAKPFELQKFDDLIAAVASNPPAPASADAESE